MNETLLELRKPVYGYRAIGAEISIAFYRCFEYARNLGYGKSQRVALTKFGAC